MKLELVSFKLCPYVQRSVITLNYKKVKFDMTFIDLENPPAWFEKISPLGRVPVLKVDDKTVLFESAVINEFIDETVGTPLLSTDPLGRAFERAWIQFGSEVMGTFYGLSMETDPKALSEIKFELFDYLKRLEEVVDLQGPYFRGQSFSLVDSTFAPLFMRMALSKKFMDEPMWKELPKTTRWQKSLLEMPEVKNSVVREFNELFFSQMKKTGSLLY